MGPRPQRVHCRTIGPNRYATTALLESVTRLRIRIVSGEPFSRSGGIAIEFPHVLAAAGAFGLCVDGGLCHVAESVA